MNGQILSNCSNSQFTHTRKRKLKTICTKWGGLMYIRNLLRLMIFVHIDLFICKMESVLAAQRIKALTFQIIIDIGTFLHILIKYRSIIRLFPYI